MAEDSKECHSQNPSAVNWNPLFCETCTNSLLNNPWDAQAQLRNLRGFSA
jgi:hypothetical protein